MKAQVISAPNPVEMLARLKKIVGARVLRSLQEHKSLLHIWRRTTPHNWFVRNKRGDTTWHSSDGGSRPSLSMFEKVADSDKIIVGPPMLIGSDAGRPEETIYRLRPEFCRL